jgi:hypothetical protein
MLNPIPLPSNTPTPPEKGEARLLLQWTAKPYHVHERSQTWYMWAGIAAVVLAVFAILTGSWTFAVVILLSAGVYFLLRNHEPAEQTMEIFEDGVRCKGTYWHWKDFKGFFLKTTPLFTELHLVPAQKRSMAVVMQTGDTDLRALRETLNERLTQLSDAEESVLDTFIRLSKL